MILLKISSYIATIIDHKLNVSCTPEQKAQKAGVAITASYITIDACGDMAVSTFSFVKY